ncbi:TPA: thioredoxin domain-containing protein, partial [Raoultella ornithinolytica]
MVSKLRRWLRELMILLLLAGALIVGMDYLRRPALPPNLTTTPLQTLEGNVVDLHAMSQQRPLLIYVWATWCGVCRYTTPSVAALASNGGNV